MWLFIYSVRVCHYAYNEWYTPVRTDMPYSMHRVFCATPEDLEPERQAFYRVTADFNESTAMCRGILFTPVSITPGVTKLAPFRAVIDQNIGDSRYYVQVLADSFGAPERNFEPLFQAACRQAANPQSALQETVVLLKRTDAAPDARVARLRRDLEDGAGLRWFPYSDGDEFCAIVRALLASWIDSLAPAPQPPAWTLRPATAEDEPFVAELITATLADQLAAWAWDESMREPILRMQYEARRSAYRQQFPDAERSIVVADGRSIGYQLVWRNAESIRLVDIAIAAGHRRAGIGTALIRALQSEADRAGKPLHLQVSTQNPALRLYQRLGFVPTGGNEAVLELRWQAT